MIAELGHFSLILALIAGLIQGFLPLAGTALGVRSWVNVARPAVFANAVFWHVRILLFGLVFLHK